MHVLPTSKESEALPELRLLRDLAETLCGTLGAEVHENEQLEKFLAEECLA